jgi:hypothetical protein
MMGRMDEGIEISESWVRCNQSDIINKLLFELVVIIEQRREEGWVKTKILYAAIMKVGFFVSLTSRNFLLWLVNII